MRCDDVPRVSADRRPGIVVGMKSEAALLPGQSVLCSGGVTAVAEAQARALVEAGAKGLLSFGVAGGLAPDLAPGVLIVASGVVVEDETFPVDEAWSGRLAKALPQARTALVAGVRRPVADGPSKQALYEGSGALAVDMESGAVALVARAAGVPFAVLRAVADPAGRALPPAALVGLGPDGEARPWRVVRELLRRPQDLPGLIRLAGESKAALGALGAACRSLGPALGFEPG